MIARAAGAGDFPRTGAALHRYRRRSIRLPGAHWQLVLVQPARLVHEAVMSVMTRVAWALGLAVVVVVLIAGWLLRWDIAPRKWRSPGWLGHTAWCLSIGYVWLLLGALLGLAGLRWPGGATAPRCGRYSQPTQPV